MAERSRRSMFSIGYDLYCISSHRPSCYPNLFGFSGRAAAVKTPERAVRVSGMVLRLWPGIARVARVVL